jgi:NNP family nitrate/nitrite transporter-like MFS transporter
MSRATALRLHDFTSPPMRAFHLAWSAFFLSFMAWFAVAPLMPVIRADLALTPEQVADSVIASISITILARLAIGRLLDRYGPRRVYAWLLVLGSLPVMSIGLAHSYESFLLCRMAIGAIGASFVVTQLHTTLMFAPNVVGTANALAAGWGNLGGGATQLAMPLVLALFVGLGVEQALGWRLALLVPGLALFAMGLCYARFAQDTPEGGFVPAAKETAAPHGLRAVARDPRVFALFAAYAACFGVEITLANVGALYFHDRFGLGLGAAGAVAAAYGGMNLFSRALGGWLSDRAGAQRAVAGRTALLGALLLGEGLALVAFGRAESLATAVPALLVVALFVQMASGATFGIVPFVNRRALGAVAGIVGAGGNVGGILAGVLLRAGGLTGGAFATLGAGVVCVAALASVLTLWCEGREREPQSAPVGVAA